MSDDTLSRINRLEKLIVVDLVLTATVLGDTFLELILKIIG